MIKLPLRELEEAIRNPSEYRSKLSHPTVSFFKYSYYLALRNAIFRYHQPGITPLQAREYLEDQLSKFKNSFRVEDTFDQYEWYVAHHANCGLTTFETRLTVQVPMTSKPTADIKCSGQLGRLDIRPLGGYAAWLFRSRDHLNWTSELQMPLIQYAVAHALGVDAAEITVGIYSFDERFVDEYIYSQIEISVAYSKLDQLLTSLGI